VTAAVTTLSAAALADVVTAEKAFVSAFATFATLCARPRSGVAALASGIGVSFADDGAGVSSALRVEEEVASVVEAAALLPLGLGRPLM
jgi:hypothetical protein